MRHIHFAPQKLCEVLCALRVSAFRFEKTEDLKTEEVRLGAAASSIHYPPPAIPHDS
jgi:hypothetical protein